MKRTTILMAFVACGVFGGTASAVTVAANDNIYGAGFGSPPDGSLPQQINLLAGDQYLTFAVTGGPISYNNGGNLNDADGSGSGSSEEISAFNSLSGINGYQAGFLVGVFEDGTPSGSAPGPLSYPDSTSTSFVSASPLIDQTFFIGDGLTADGTGSVQEFFVPSGATALYLGFADACGYNGPPDNCYGDNTGSFNVAVTEIGSAPEPTTIVLIGLGLAGLGLVRRKPRQ